MRQKVQYLYVELKKTISMFPRMLSQAILLMILIGAIAFCGIKGMEREPLAVTVDIGVVMQEENTMTRMALGYVENMESASQVCHFIQMSEEEGFRKLERGEVAALIVLPKQLVEGIMNGNNPAVSVYFPKNAGLEAMLLHELTESGAGMLKVAQAQIYGAYDVAAEYGLMEQLSVMESEIDSYNLAFALDRLAVYDDETISAAGQMSVLQYYAASGITLFLLLLGMAMYPVMQREPATFCRQLKRQGTGSVWQCFCIWLCGFLCMGLLGGVFWIICRIGIGFLSEKTTLIGDLMDSGLPISSQTGYAMGERTGIILLAMLTISMLVYLLYSFSGSKTGGILLIFLLSVVMVYLSGGFVPAVFMPQMMQRVGSMLPTSYLIHAFGSLFVQYRAGALGECAAGLCGYTAVFAIAAYFLRSSED